MHLNTLQPAPGSKKARTRVGRGHSAGQGKTCGRGVKGQKSRSGGFHKVGFEGGQMPLQRRIPKFGFTSKVSATVAEVRLNELNLPQVDVIDLDVLKAHGVVRHDILRARVFASGEIKQAITLRGIHATKGAAAAIVAAGGKVEE